MKTYTYDSVNRLVQVSNPPSGTSQSSVNLAYNGLGQRLRMDAAGVIAHYVMDTSTSASTGSAQRLSASSDRPLTAETGGNTTFYLYGLGVIGEKTAEWNFSLPDGTNTPRQLTDMQGDVTLSARYTPWGDSLELHGTGNFSFGYLGGVLDATTGLIYVGNGQYYDPETGRFLTRDVNPDSTNPYVPWNPIGAIVGPLGVIALVFGRRKKGSKAGTFLVALLVVGSVGVTLAGCQFTTNGYDVTVTQSPAQPNTYTVTLTPKTTPSSTPAPTDTPLPTITVTCTVTPIPTDNLDLYFASLPEPYAKMPGKMAISQRGIDFIKFWENFEPSMYNDGEVPGTALYYNRTGEGEGHCTIGYGHLVHRKSCNRKEYGSIEKYFENGIEEPDAYKLLVNIDIPAAERYIRENVKVKLTQSQYDALVSLVFNWGGDKFLASETKLPLLNSGQYVATANDIIRGPIESDGKILDSLKRRRKAEAEMFLELVNMP